MLTLNGIGIKTTKEINQHSFPLTDGHMEYLRKFQTLLSRHKDEQRWHGQFTPFAKRKLLAKTLVNQILNQTVYGVIQQENLNELKPLYLELLSDLKTQE